MSEKPVSTGNAVTYMGRVDFVEVARARAMAYRAEHGDPVDNLATLLSSIADSETWEEVIDDPNIYGED